MLSEILAVGTVVGGIIGVSAYLPQFLHLFKVKNSTGLSLWAWYMWFIGDGLMMAYAIDIKNVPYIIANSLYTLASALIIILIYKYRKK